MTKKKALLKLFKNNWKKHYNLDVFKERGYKRRVCSICKRTFWSIKERSICGECEGYSFIGKKINNLNYIETWKTIEKYFISSGHTYIKPYPTVARWRDDLYFTIASINDFQPYVVNGELEPPANPLIVPQPCIRFNDIPNVGITGRHYTNFVMIGQHAFNKEKLFYWKEEAIFHDINYLKKLGLKEEEIVFMEDVWVGGGNLGPSIEYFYNGLELGNCVFMQYEETDSGFQELKTKVIDMGAGLNRLAWIINGTPTSYDIVFDYIIKTLKNKLDLDYKLLREYSKYASLLNIDEAENIEEEKTKIAKKLGVDKKQLFKEVEKMQAIYAIADHTLTALFTIKDGMFPSNSGGGYNIRLILRRMFDFEEKFSLDIDYYKILSLHANHLTYMFPDLKEAISYSGEIINQEKKKYNETKIRVEKKIKKINENIGFEELKKLYESEGITPQMIKKYKKIKIPPDFYLRIQKQKEKKKIEEKINFPKTEMLYYTNITKFKAKIIGIKGNWVILDKTAFYPESGGQIYDTGEINGVKVIKVKKINGVVLHKVEHPKFKLNQEVECLVDIKRRKLISKNHTAAHIINAAARKVLGNHVWQAGSYKDDKIAHLDITHYKRIEDEELRKIEMIANQFVMMNKEIKIEILPRNIAEEKYGFRLYQGGAIPGKELRIVNIQDIDVEACGGTHHMNKKTGELGLIKIIRRENVKDGVERIVFSSGESAIKYINEEEKILKNCAKILKVNICDLENTTKRFFEEWKERGKKIEKLSNEILKQKVELLAKSEKKVEVIDLEQKFLILLGNKVKDKCEKIIINNMGEFIIVSNKNNAKKIYEKLKKIKARGGGNESMVIGKLPINQIKNIDSILF